MAISIMDRLLAKQPPTEQEISRMTNNQARLNQVYTVANVKPIITHTVYEDVVLMQEAVDNAKDNGLVLDEFEVVKYDLDNIQFASRFNTTILLSSPAVTYDTDMLSYNRGKFGITDEEIEDLEHYHNGIDYGIDSIGKHVDISEKEVPDLDELINIASNSELLNFALMQDIDLT